VVRVRWERYMCTLQKHVPSMSVRCEHCKAIESNLDYLESLGLDEIVWIIKGPDH